MFLNYFRTTGAQIKHLLGKKYFRPTGAQVRRHKDKTPRNMATIKSFRNNNNNNNSNSNNNNSNSSLRTTNKATTQASPHWTNCSSNMDSSPG